MAIQVKHGRARSYVDLAELEESLRTDIARLSPDELEAFRLLVGELTLGTVEPGERLLDAATSVVWRSPPVDMETFIRDPYFLGNTCDNLYPQLLEDLKELFEGDYNEAIFCGSIGYGKTYAASIGMCRLLYELSCMRDPQKAFGLAPGSLIALANMSVNETLAKKVVLENIGSKIKPSPYFQQHFPFEDTQKEFRFPNHVWLVARATTDTSVLGLNIISAILDETNFMYRNAGKQSSSGDRYGVIDQAETLYNSIKRRMKSRFQSGGKLPGILFIVSSKQTSDDFTSRRINAGLTDPHVFVRDYALWEVKPAGHYSSDTFWVLCGNENIPSKVLDPGEEERYKGDKCPDNCVLLEVPSDFRQDFTASLESAIRDIAGIATVAISPFIQRREKIQSAVDVSRFHPFSVTDYNPHSGGKWIWEAMVKDYEERDSSGIVRKVSRPILNPRARRHVHIDPSLRKDAAGFCMSHMAGVKAVVRRAEDGREFVERAPIYVVDVILRIVPPVGGELLLSDFRHLIYELTSRGYPITDVTLDSYQSADTIQQLHKKGYSAEVLSVDISPEPYDELKLALYEDRITYYEYPTLIRELQSIQEENKGHRRKIDHPVRGSKDCSDALAGTVYSLLKKVHSEPLPLLQGSLVNEGIWMPEQAQTLHKPVAEVTPHNMNLPPLFIGSQGGSGWGNDF